MLKELFGHKRGLGRLRQQFLNARRVKEILIILIKYGFGYIVDRLHIEKNIIGKLFLAKSKIKKKKIKELSGPVRFRKALEDLGPTFVKLGQILSMRPDLVSFELSKELEKLQDEVPSFSYEKVREQIESELGSEVDDIFTSFSKEPCASASLSQVHKAVYNGRKVIVKVQRPDIEETVHTDIEILYYLARLINKYIEESRIFNPVGIVEEFERIVVKELDFSREAYNMDRFRRQFEEDESIYIPEVFHELTTEKILVIEEIEGIKISKVEELEKAVYNTGKLTEIMVNATLKQIFEHGFFHGDPHPGNIMVVDGKITFFDCGMVGRLPHDLRIQLANALTYFVQKDVLQLRETFLKIGRKEGRVDVSDLDLDLEDFVERYYAKPLKEMNIGKILIDLIHIFTKYKISFPNDLFLLSKVLIVTDANARKLDPDFNLVRQVKPFIKKLEKQKYNPQKIASDIRLFLRDVSGLLQRLPEDIRVILGRVKQGTFTVNLEHKRLDSLVGVINKLSTRIPAGLIISALIIGSSIIIHTDKGPKLFDLPVIGLGGFLIAAVMGLWLIVGVFLSNRKF